MLGYPTNRAQKNKKILKKVEHICSKSYIMELTRNHDRRTKYALLSFYRRFTKFARCYCKKIKKIENIIYIHIEMPVLEHICPICGEKTKYIHDYRCRTIKDLPAFNQQVVLIYRQRRYICHKCGKRFSEENTFVPRYYQITKRLINEMQSVTQM